MFGECEPWAGLCKKVQALKVLSYYFLSSLQYVFTNGIFTVSYIVSEIDGKKSPIKQKTCSIYDTKIWPLSENAIPETDNY